MLEEVIRSRHSVRKYISKAITADVVATLQAKVDACNAEGDLHIQLVLNEKKAFTGLLSYGSFSGVENYFVMVGKKTDDLDERIGYYGEQLVLLSQTLGLNTCWVGLSYRKTDAYVVGEGEKLVCVIALGYGQTQGVAHKIKSVEQVSNCDTSTPGWFRKGVEMALLAPTAVNQQKFFFEYLGRDGGDQERVAARRKFSLVGYTAVDLGIAKFHFEEGADGQPFVWIK